MKRNGKYEVYLSTYDIFDEIEAHEAQLIFSTKKEIKNKSILYKLHNAKDANEKALALKDAYPNVYSRYSRYRYPRNHNETNRNTKIIDKFRMMVDDGKYFYILHKK